jgi:hypothetical protein
MEHHSKSRGRTSRWLRTRYGIDTRAGVSVGTAFTARRRSGNCKLCRFPIVPGERMRRLDVDTRHGWAHVECLPPWLTPKRKRRAKR